MRDQRSCARVSHRAEDSVLVDDIIWAPLQLVGRNPSGLVHNLEGCLVYSRATDRHGSRVERAGPEWYRLRVSLHHVDVVKRNSKHTGRNLGETGGMTLAGALRTAEHSRPPVGMDHHARAFVAGSPEPDRTQCHRRSGTGTLRKSREADTEMTALSAQTGLLRAQLAIACQFQGRVHVGDVIARIKRQPGR